MCNSAKLETDLAIKTCWNYFQSSRKILFGPFIQNVLSFCSLDLNLIDQNRNYREVLYTCTAPILLTVSRVLKCFPVDTRIQETNGNKMFLEI